MAIDSPAAIRTGCAQANTPSATPNSTTEENATSWPMPRATAPTTGPSCTPKIAAPIALSEQRAAPLARAPRPRSTTSRPPRARAADALQEAAPPSSTPIVSAKANTRHETDISVRPTITVAFTPAVAISHPAGSEPTSVPAA